MISHIYEQSGCAVGFISGRFIHDMRGSAIGQLNGIHVRKLQGQNVGEVDRDWCAGVSIRPRAAQATQLG